MAVMSIGTDESGKAVPAPDTGQTMHGQAATASADKLIVHAMWARSGELFLWGTRGRGMSTDALELKHQLFAWHEPSFYGTFIETTEWMNKEGALLPAALALDYFCETPQLRHAPFEWSRELAALKRLAPAIRETLLAGRCMPDYEQWLKGRIAWKPQLPEELHEAATPLVHEWTDMLISEWVRERPEFAEALRKLESTLPRFGLSGEAAAPPDERATEPATAGDGAAGAGGATGPGVPAATGRPWLDEDDWLVHIGWLRDPSPFRTCLQLIEPEEGREWRLQLLLQDRRNDDALLACSAQGEPEAGAELPAGWEPHLARVGKDVQRWLHILPWLREEAVAGAAPAEAPQAPPRLREYLSHDEAWEFLAHGSVRLAEAGCAVFLPAWWERLRSVKPRLRAKLKSTAAGGTPQTMFGLTQIMQFDWKLAIDDLELSEEEFRKLLEQKRKLVHFRGRWIQLDPRQLAQIEQAMKQVKKKRGMTLRDVLAIHLSGSGAGALPEAPDESTLLQELQYEIELNDHLRHLVDQLRQQADIPRIETPTGFRGHLRPYQLDGISWLLFLRRFGLGACLADDMGLGKTIQWITYLLAVKEREPDTGPSLLVCPTSVLGNWQKELERFSPSLRVHLHYGSNRRKGEAFEAAAAQADLVLTSYTLSHLDEEELGRVEWHSICLDEAQNIKNAYTKQASSIRKLSGDHRIALTGTPMENRLTELWSIFDFLNPGYLGSLRAFSHRFVQPIEKTKDTAAIAQVQRLIRPFLMRRLKSDPSIQLDLPEKNESKTFVSLSAEQASLYENYIQDMFSRLEKLTAMERRGLILTALTKLKQLCNHPALLYKEPAAQTATRGAGAGSDKRRPELAIAWKGRSNKIERLLDMTRELRQEGDRCLIFTQFVETGHMLQSILQKELEETVLFLHGGVPKAARDAMIERFQDASTPPEESAGIFLLSLKAGGTGLNLTAANHVFHFDRWWNPAVEQQATDRAFRIGQTRHVQVHKFVTLGTLEERIDEMIESKMGLTQQIVGGGENWITELSTGELRDLFALRREWIEG